MKKAYILFYFGLIGSSIFAQSASTFSALNQFVNTSFFEEYDELKRRAETSVRNFKAIQSRYEPEDVQAVKDAYNASANVFNGVLLNIKNDLLMREKRKFLVGFPEDYSKQVKADLYDAKAYYENTYQREITGVTDGEITGASFLALLPNIIKYAKAAMQIITKVKNELKNFNEGLLDKHLIEKYKFKEWDEI
jgi:hypothetical protein